MVGQTNINFFTVHLAPKANHCCLWSFQVASVSLSWSSEWVPSDISVERMMSVTSLSIGTRWSIGFGQVVESWLSSLPWSTMLLLVPCKLRAAMSEEHNLLVLSGWAHHIWPKWQAGGLHVGQSRKATDKGGEAKSYGVCFKICTTGLSAFMSNQCSASVMFLKAHPIRKLWNHEFPETSCGLSLPLASTFQRTRTVKLDHTFRHELHCFGFFFIFVLPLWFIMRHFLHQSQHGLHLSQVSHHLKFCPTMSPLSLVLIVALWDQTNKKDFFSHFKQKCGKLSDFCKWVTLPCLAWLMNLAHCSSQSELLFLQILVFVVVRHSKKWTQRNRWTKEQTSAVNFAMCQHNINAVQEKPATLNTGFKSWSTPPTASLVWFGKSPPVWMGFLPKPFCPHR